MYPFFLAKQFPSDWGTSKSWDCCRIGDTDRNYVCWERIGNGMVEEGS